VLVARSTMIAADLRYVGRTYGEIHYCAYGVCRIVSRLLQRLRGRRIVLLRSEDGANNFVTLKGTLDRDDRQVHEALGFTGRVVFPAILMGRSGERLKT
jgi:hypothetical protein